jgi:hypothetical protein
MKRHHYLLFQGGATLTFMTPSVKEKHGGPFEISPAIDK